MDGAATKKKKKRVIKGAHGELGKRKKVGEDIKTSSSLSLYREWGEWTKEEKEKIEIEPVVAPIFFSPF